MTTVLLIRHALNRFAEKQRLAGWLPGIHLSEDGQAQAAALAERMASQKLEAIYSSPLERAWETAEAIARPQGLTVIRREALGEIRFGRWEGQPLKTLRRRKLWPIIQFRPSLARFPEGEAFFEAQARIVAEIEKLRGQHRGRNRTIACVFHADPIKLVIAHYLGLPLDNFQRLEIHPASISALSFEGAHTRLLSLNSTPASDAHSLG